MSDRISANRELQKTILEALGEHAALTTNHADRWFDLIQARLGRLEEQLSSRLASPASPSPAAVEDSSQAARSALPAPLPGAARAEPHPAAALLSLPTFTPPVLEGPLPELVTTSVASFDTGASWDGWRFHQGVKMLPGGVVELKQDRSTPGVVSEPIALRESGLLRFTIDCEISLERGGPRPHARIVDERDGHLGPLVELANGVNTFFMFAAHHVKALRLFVINVNPKTGYRLHLRTVEVETVEPESYFARCRAKALAPAIASMATIPARRRMLEDCVKSLLLQCDRVRVFLNEYPDVPAFLNHPRIDVRRSQDWDDKGDAGKFGWVDLHEEPGYRLIVDDDLVFPPDFVEKMSEKVNNSGNRGIFAMHGVLLKQPVSAYYDPESRSVFHFESALRQDRTCHVLGTNAMCYYSGAVQMTWSDFMFRNMADIFLARYAQQHGLPMITPARPQHWVRQNSQEGGFETIYDNSLKKTRSKFDSSAVQDALVKWSAPLTLQPTARPKIVFLLVGFGAETFKATLASWEKTRWHDYDWVVIVVGGSEDPELRRQVATSKVPNEIHVVDPQGSSGAERVVRAVELAEKIGFDLLCVACDSFTFEGGAWTKPVVGAIEKGSPDAVFLVAGQRGGRPQLLRQLPGGTVPNLAVANREVVERAGAPRAAKGESAASALRDWLMRIAEANQGKRNFADREAAVITGAVHGAETPPPALQLGAWKPVPAAQQALPFAPVPCLTVNDFFKKVWVINLDRRPDRWAKVSARLTAAGIAAERFAATDGRAADIAAEFQAYSASPLRDAGTVVRRVRSSKEFFQDYDSEAARVAFVEQRDGKKAIQSAGAWGYLKTWERILEQVLVERIPTALVLDDDVAFHKATGPLFAAAVGGLPEDWLILQLGTLQYEWSPDWLAWTNRFLYRTNGSAVGSHAVGFRLEIAPFLLEHVKRMLLPFDTGALAMATRAFAGRCFVTYPNIAIQSLAETSDISTSDFQKAADRARIAQTYRWDLACYES
jgi:GR25 family glycosyltransferase involved in LPS biosynthesis